MTYFCHIIKIMIIIDISRVIITFGLLNRRESMTLKTVKNIIGILLGNTLYALAVVLFIVPSGLITGGSTG